MRTNGPNISVLGTGLMGFPMACRLLAAE